jgi:GrpB-like predicted nucleotidyltransferase (UPF0157 family)
VKPSVEIRPYDPGWPRLAADEIKQVGNALEAKAVEHIGSTSVPGLAAKPIIDLLAGLDAPELPPERVAAMEELGYEYLGEYGLPGRLYFRKGDPRTFHVHAVELGGRQWARHLAVRDYLRSSPEEVALYAAAKHSVAAAASGDWDAYCDGKGAFVDDLERRALRWRGFEKGRP